MVDAEAHHRGDLAHGHQTLFYAEGNWNAHLESFAELPDQSIIYHVDRDDIFDVHRRIGHKFCLSGGISNYLLSYGSPAEVRQHCRQVLEVVAADGGYIMDAGAIMQDDTHPENMRAMTETTRQYGVYSSSSPPPELPTPAAPRIPAEAAAAGYGMAQRPAPPVRPGICTSWEEKRKELPQVSGDELLLKDIWEQIESFGNTFIWQCLLSF